MQNHAVVASTHANRKVSGVDLSAEASSLAVAALSNLAKVVVYALVVARIARLRQFFVARRQGIPQQRGCDDEQAHQPQCSGTLHGGLDLMVRQVLLLPPPPLPRTKWLSARSKTSESNRRENSTRPTAWTGCAMLQRRPKRPRARLPKKHRRSFRYCSLAPRLYHSPQHVALLIKLCIRSRSLPLVSAHGYLDAFAAGERPSPHTTKIYCWANETVLQLGITGAAQQWPSCAPPTVSQIRWKVCRNVG